MRALGAYVVLGMVVSCLATTSTTVEANANEHQFDAKAEDLNLASTAQHISASASDSDSDASMTKLRRVVRHLRKLNEDDENDNQEEDADRDEQSQQSQDDEDEEEEEQEQNRDQDKEQQGSYNVQGEYKNDYQGYQSKYKSSGGSSSSSTTSDASADNATTSCVPSLGGGIAVWSLTAVAISLYALVGVRSFYRRYGDRDIYTGAGVPGGSGNNSVVGELAGMDDKKVNLILPSGKELECENTVVSAMTGYPAPL